MTLFDDQLDNAILCLIDQWNIAERRIKKAEQVRANEVVASAIFELRYAGRKLIDALDIALKDDWKNDGKIHEKICSYVYDATEDCVKAKHDAVDAMVDFVTTWFSRYEDRHELDTIQQFFPEYLMRTAQIRDIQEKIAISRHSRNQSRDQTYNEIENTGYNDILDLFNTMKNSHDRVDICIKKRKKTDKTLWWSAIIGVIVGVLGLAVGAAGFVVAFM